MSAVEMSRLTLVGLATQKADIMESLIRLGAVELDEMPPQPVPQNLEPYDERGFLSLNSVSRLEAAAEYCRQQDPQSHHMGSAKRLAQAEDFVLAGQREREIMGQLHSFEQIQSQIAQLRTSMAQDETVREILTPWDGLELDLATTATRETVVFAGAFPSRDALEAFLVQAREEAPETHVEVFSEDTASVRVVVITLKFREGLVHTGLRQHGFHLLPALGLAGKPRQILAGISDRSDDNQRRLERLEKELQDFASQGKDFELLHDYYLLQSDKIDALSCLPGTANTFYLTGWVPARLADDMTRALKQRFLVAAETRPPVEGESPPVQLNNHTLVKPYEIIVEMFSPPSHEDVDPSPLLAPFFFLFFGMMLSDIGYGLVLTVLTGYMAFKKKATGEMGRMSRMLFISGIGSIIWGILFGGFFGDMLTVLSQGKIVVPSLWFNPMEEPMTLMVWSMLFGVLHLFTAMGAKIYLLAKTGKVFDALVDVAPWYLVITGLGLMLGGDSLIPGVSLKFAGQVMAIAGAAVLLLFGGRDSKNPILRLVKGLLSLYNITAYFSDILSYTRILALVLATSVIAMVFNKLGFMLGPTPVGYVVFIVAALIGHTLNLALSALSAYVHTSRLHYVEFFSKFYEGGGRLFKPLRIRTRFIQFDRKP